MTTQGSLSGPGSAPGTEPQPNPWHALWALAIGFFMIMVDTSILTVATPAIVSDLDASVNEVIWVTSAYLLAYAVPLLITGRLGDRYGPRRVYLTGLVLFTVASIWCGLCDSASQLVVARAFQGLGASLMTPQTMAVITRTFPIERRGSAMALWGATAGLATLAGPLIGGVLVEHLGWQWIFFVNVPVGVVALVMALRLVPALQTSPHRFDWLGVVLFGAGMLALVFGIQEAGQHGWGAVATAGSWQITVRGLLVAGVGLLALFVFWQSRNTAEPLLPLSLFRDRNFSVANIAAACVSFSFMAMGFPLMLYAQSVRGWDPLPSGLLMAPLAACSILLAPVVGRLTDRVHPRMLVAFGFACAAASMCALALALDATTPVWVAVACLTLLGLGSAFLWGPLSATANRNLPPLRAGAGAGVFNTTRQIGSVVGAACAALMIDHRLAASGLPASGGEGALQASTALPPALAEAYSAALGEAIWIVPAVFCLGLVTSLFFEYPKHLRRPEKPAPSRPASERDVPHIAPSAGGRGGSQGYEAR